MEAMEEKKAHLFSNRDLRRLIAPMIIEQLLAILVLSLIHISEPTRPY